MLLVRQLNAQPNGQAVGVVAAAVGGFHDARAATSDGRVTRLRQRLAQVEAPLVVRAILWQTCRTIYRHRRRNLRQRTKAVNELRLNAQHTPGIVVQPVRVRIV